MIDLVELQLIAGDGGRGKISFRKEKYVPKGGPDGGDGGRGGSIIIRASEHKATLADLAGVTQIKAPSGGDGAARQQHGRDGLDQVLELPVGSVISLLAENQTSAYRRERYAFINADGSQQLLNKADLRIGQVPPKSLIHWQRYYQDYEVKNANLDREADELEALDQPLELVRLTEPGQELVICQGGFGGRGNVHFKSGRQTTPREAEYGTFGEQKTIKIELKLLADVALVGLPNAGKSTLLSRLTAARPKIANYPFTTLEPKLGILTDPQLAKELVIADIPGLISGASQGKGLGHDFLRHIENCRTLLYVLFLSEEAIFDTQLTDQKRGQLLWQQYQNLRFELKEHQPELLDKQFLVTLNKADLYTAKQIKSFKNLFQKQQTDLSVISASTSQGLDSLKQALAQLA